MCNHTLKGKEYTQNTWDIEIKWCVGEFFLKVFFFKYWRKKFTAFFFKKIREITTLIFCYLIVNNQLKYAIIYKKIAMRADDDER